MKMLNLMCNYKHIIVEDFMRHVDLNFEVKLVLKTGPSMSPIKNSK